MSTRVMLVLFALLATAAFGRRGGLLSTSGSFTLSGGSNDNLTGDGEELGEDVETLKHIPSLGEASGRDQSEVQSLDIGQAPAACNENIESFVQRMKTKRGLPNSVAADNLESGIQGLVYRENTDNTKKAKPIFYGPPLVKGNQRGWIQEVKAGNKTYGWKVDGCGDMTVTFNCLTNADQEVTIQNYVPEFSPAVPELELGESSHAGRRSTPYLCTENFKVENKKITTIHVKTLRLGVCVVQLPPQASGPTEVELGELPPRRPTRGLGEATECDDKQPPSNWKFNTCALLKKNGRCNGVTARNPPLCLMTCGKCSPPPTTPSPTTPPTTTPTTSPPTTPSPTTPPPTTPPPRDSAADQEASGEASGECAEKKIVLCCKTKFDGLNCGDPNADPNEHKCSPDEEIEVFMKA